jgi:hypothetical protein
MSNGLAVKATTSGHTVSSYGMGKRRGLEEKHAKCGRTATSNSTILQNSLHKAADSVGVQVNGCAEDAGTNVEVSENKLRHTVLKTSLRYGLNP